MIPRDSMVKRDCLIFALEHNNDRSLLRWLAADYIDDAVMKIMMVETMGIPFHLKGKVIMIYVYDSSITCFEKVKTITKALIYFALNDDISALSCVERAHFRYFQNEIGFLMEDALHST